MFGSALYADDETDDGTAAAIGASLGCGVPTAVADLHEGETVLDLGSGAGADVLISARRVGPTGPGDRSGHDRRDARARARATPRRPASRTSSSSRATSRSSRSPTTSVDVVISNCVINLSGDKPRVLREAARVLRPGGRFAVSDVIADPDMDERTRADMAAWTGCIAGALTEDEFRHALEEPASRVSRSARPTASTSTPPPRSSGPASRTRTMTAELQLNDPQTLYRRWEDSQWSPTRSTWPLIRHQWRALGEDQRELIYFVLASLMVAEERITTKFSGLVAAGASEEEVTFLATQQVDEARHMQFYARYQDEVIASPAQIAAHVERAREQTSDAFLQIFDVALVEAHQRLLADPGDLTAKVCFITLYHLILEGTLGLTSFKFITDYLNQNELLPGFVEGYSLIHHDETRHIGYGVWFLRETIREHPEQADGVRTVLRKLLPHVAESLKLPGDDDASSVLGVSEDELRAFALNGLTRRLQIIGIPLDTVFA